MIIRDCKRTLELFYGSFIFLLFFFLFLCLSFDSVNFFFDGYIEQEYVENVIYVTDLEDSISF